MPLLDEKGVIYLASKLVKVTQDVGDSLETDIFIERGFTLSLDKNDTIEDVSRQTILKKLLMDPDYIESMTIVIEDLSDFVDEIPVIFNDKNRLSFIGGYIKNKFITVTGFEMNYVQLLKKYPFAFVSWTVTSAVNVKNHGINIKIRIFT
jgi:hypothetical protein